MARDWKGGTASTFKTIGASNHCDHDREKDDYYATHPLATEYICKLENLNQNIWECACGEGHMAEVLKKRGFNVRCTDLIDRGYGEVLDFLKSTEQWDGDIITNPPYKYAQEFVLKALHSVNDGAKVCMFLKLTFLEGKGRREFFKKYPPCRVWVSSSRLVCAMNGDFQKYKASATAYCWFVWQKGYQGETVIKWFN